MSDKPKFKIIIGLGNPGSEYANTYHNVGIDFLKFSLNQLGTSQFQNSGNKHFRYTKNGDLIMAEPISYMNESGKAIKEAIQYFKLSTDQILIVHDDVDIEMGDFKITYGGGSAGHRGIGSIIKELKTEDFWRLRIGIKKESAIRSALGMKAKIKAGSYVLHKVSKKDQVLINKSFERAYNELF